MIAGAKVIQRIASNADALLVSAGRGFGIESVMV